MSHSHIINNVQMHRNSNNDVQLYSLLKIYKHSQFIAKAAKPLAISD